MYTFRCYNCGKKFTTDDIRQAYCNKCENKGIIKPDPNLELKLDAREALLEKKTYGKHKR
jgi:DNA-directed RNA polymerase subunit RPC12/RpoP